MTAWLEFRAEPIVEDDFIIGVMFPPKEQPYIACTCGFHEGVTNEIEAEDVKYFHSKWHEDGMPE